MGYFSNVAENSAKHQIISFIVYCPCVTTVSDDQGNYFLFQAVSLSKKGLQVYILSMCPTLASFMKTGARIEALY